MKIAQVKLNNGQVVNVKVQDIKFGSQTKVTIFHNGYQYSARYDNRNEAFKVAVDKLKRGISC